MKLIVGLGNPGEKYQNTRHNLGFMVLDALLSKFEPHDKTFWEENKNLKANIKLLSTTKHEQRTKNQLLLTKPTTFMNNSGAAIAKVLNYYKIATSEMIVVHDDLDLPFGKIRIRFGGSAGGHRGVESIIEQLKDDKFLRVRLGVGQIRRIGDERRSTNYKLRTKNHTYIERYVLGDISSNERGKVKSMTREAVRNIELILAHGIEKYMAKYNNS